MWLRLCYLIYAKEVEGGEEEKTKKGRKKSKVSLGSSTIFQPKFHGLDKLHKDLWSIQLCYSGSSWDTIASQVLLQNKHRI